MVFYLLALKAPTNIEKKVIEIRQALFRDWQMLSSAALPAVIPLCNLASQEPPLADSKIQSLEKRLREAVGTKAPFFTTGSLLESNNCLFWHLDPEKKLAALVENCRAAFSEEQQPQPESIAVDHGFLLGMMQDVQRPESGIASLPLPSPLRFPAKAAVVFRFETLASLSAQREKRTARSADEQGEPWWQAIYWEQILSFRLRKSPSRR